MAKRSIGAWNGHIALTWHQHERLERQLGYKMAKFIMRIEVVDSFAGVYEGQGGYREDRGYQWYGGLTIKYLTKRVYPMSNKHFCYLSMVLACAVWSSGGFAATTQPKIVRGTITNVTGNKLKVNEPSGKVDHITLMKHAKIAVVSKVSLSDIKPDSYVGVAVKPKSDGTLEAIEVHIFPASMRGVGEGTRNWDLGPTAA